MTIKGVTQEEEEIIKTIIEPFKKKYDFYYYGSRVKGDFRFLSDLDIMVKGKETAQNEDIDKIKEKFDKSKLSYVVNISDFYKLDEYFYKLIEQDLVKIL